MSRPRRRERGSDRRRPGTCSIRTCWRGRQEGLPRGVFLGQLTEVRLIIEPAAAELAARRAGPGRARVAAGRLARHARGARPFAAGPRGLQRARTSASTAPSCRRATTRSSSRWAPIVNSTLLVAFHAAVRVPGLARLALPRHQAILDAIRRRQPNRARAAMRRPGPEHGPRDREAPAIGAARSRAGVDRGLPVQAKKA